MFIFLKKKEKMIYMKFLFKIVIFYFGEKKRFDCKNNHKCIKLAHFWLDIIGKINYKIPVVLLYTLLRLELKKSN